ncbi:LOW QUALITY PROTEIN: SPB1-like protein [Mya arenaria]|uniref:SPB1-like protein n=1 Tax=Mya arenaria TaxID=6604 RepID=A0ABY7ES72_MYAAR|nr:LOW QUALITY PROTEIN: SPB1-like protein [Mya arenaria]
MAKLEAQLADMEGEQKKALKRKIKKTRRERGKLQHKMDMKMVLPGDKIDMSDDRELFALTKIKSKKQLETVEEVELSDADEEDEEEDVSNKKKKRIIFDREEKDYGMSDVSDEDEEFDEDDASDGSISLDEANDEENPLLVGKQSKKSKTDMWFSKESFAGLDDEDDEDVEIEKMAEAYQKKGGVIKVVPVDKNPPIKLNAQGLALGTAIVSSRKRKREVIESGYHRYMFNDDNLPDWFAKDEQRHHRVMLPVTKGEIQEYKMKMKAVDANPIRKIAEAKARRRRWREEKARKKADTINDTEEVTDREKWSQIKQVYKKAGLLSKKKKEVTYVVSKRGLAGKKTARPNGVKGPYKVVDGRLKKDIKGKMRAEQRKKGKGKKKR